MIPRQFSICLALVAAAALCAGACKQQEKGRRVKSFEPKTGVAQGGDAVVIKGQGFKSEGVPSVKIYFGGREGKNARFRGDDTVVVDTPPGEPGQEVAITMVFDDSGVIELPAKFTYTKMADSLNVDALTAGAKDDEKPAAEAEPAATDE